MKRFTALTVTAIMLFAFSFSFAGEKANVNWDEFSTSLVSALRSENEGVRISAMKLSIRHGENVDVSMGRYAVMEEFLNNDSPKVRQLALVTLSSINNTMDMGYLQRHLAYEEDDSIKKHLAAILYESDNLPANYVVSETQVAGL